MRIRDTVGAFRPRERPDEYERNTSETQRTLAPTSRDAVARIPVSVVTLIQPRRAAGWVCLARALLQPPARKAG